MKTLMLGIAIPGLTEDEDPDDVADRIVAYLNDAGFAEARITVSLWPYPQWFDTEAMDEMKTLADELRLRRFGPRGSGPDITPPEPEDNGSEATP